MKELVVLHLYPDEMNLYGDHGNVLTLEKRCEWRGIKINIVSYEPSNRFPTDVDIIFGGGGQDSGQLSIQQDWAKIGERIKSFINDGTPALFICGFYQLLGEYYRTSSGEVIHGIHAVDATTVGGNERFIGNVVLKSKKFGQIVGYENHSGQTTLSRYLEPLGIIQKGAGNNGKDGTEGCIHKNCIGTYLHGPILPKNPQIADFLIKTALGRKYSSDHKLKKLDDGVEWAAHRTQAARPR